VSKSSVQLTERATISSIAASLEADAIIELYELDLSSVPTLGVPDTLRFHAGVTDQDSEISWQGNVYNAFPIEAKGFEMTGKGQIPRPSLQVANITTTSNGQGWGSISALTRDFDDLVGVKVVRKRTFGRFLDNYCSINEHTHSGRCSEDSWNDSHTDCCVQGGGAWDADEATCIGSEYTWVGYSCHTCAIPHCSDFAYTTESACEEAEKFWYTEGVWHVNNKSNWVALNTAEWGLEGGQNHSHSITVPPETLCSLGEGSKESITSCTNKYVLPDIRVYSVGSNGEILEYYIEDGGSGWPDVVENLEVVASRLPDLGVGAEEGIYSSHTHVIDPPIEDLNKLISGDLLEVEARTEYVFEHAHQVLVTYDPVNTRFVLEFIDNWLTVANHTTPHSLEYNVVTSASFSNPLFSGGALTSFTLASGGMGYSVDDVIALKDIPSWVAHSHDVQLEYKYQGNDIKELVKGTDSSFKGDVVSWFPTVGAEITSNYNGEGILRIESNGIGDGAYMDLSTFKDSEYLVSFQFNIVEGSDCSVKVEYLDADLLWVEEWSEPLEGTGWQTFEKVFYTSAEMYTATRVSVFAAGPLGGELDEILISTFNVSQTWVRGDIVARSITFNDYDQHGLEYIHNLIINTSDPTAFMEDDIYFIDRKAVESNILIEFELAPAWDVEGVRLPSREIIQNTCLWRYRGGECGYTGDNYFDYNDQLTVESRDTCGKRLNSCELRFGSSATLPYGGFPGAGLGR